MHPSTETISQHALDVAARIGRVARSSSDDLVNQFCLPEEGSVAQKEHICGCQKYVTCPLVPDYIKQLKPALLPHDVEALKHLKKVGCLRFHFATRPELKTLLQTGQLTAGDFFGALGKTKGERVTPSQILGSPHCPYHGCVVPEMLDGIETKERAAAVTSGKVCPFGRTKASRSVKGTTENRHRLLACRLTRPAFVGLQKELRVISLSPIILLPVDDGNRCRVVYVGKNPEAGFQFVTIDPSTFASDEFAELPNAQARLHGPLLVRDHSDTGLPDHLGGQRDTLRWLAALKCQNGVSPLEWEAGCRYIPAAEFTFVCLLWLITGEHENVKTTLTDPREVDLERKGDSGFPNSPLLLHMLSELGLIQELRNIFGNIVRHTPDCWTRSASRLDDLYELGLVDAPDDGSLILRPGGIALSQWLLGAAKLLNQEPAGPLSVYCAERLQIILNPAADAKWQQELQQFAERLVASVGDGIVWGETLNLFLNAFFNQMQRRDFRQTLRVDAFPVYPLVHLAMLFGVRQPLDWLAIPLGGAVTGSTEEEVYPQGAAYLLASARAPQQVIELATTLAPVLDVPISAYATTWAEHVITQQKAELSVTRAKLAVKDKAYVCPSKAMEEVYQAVGDFARSQATVLLVGETGAGKEIIAQLIHDTSDRAKSPFIPVNIARLDERLFDSELFGAKKGAYTSLDRDKIGKVEAAKDGTLFLDEITTAPRSVQAKLLRFLSEKQYDRVGDPEIRTAQCRILVATNENLNLLVNTGGFRSDLFHRIALPRIEVPPLRSRPEDIAGLFGYCVAKYARRDGLESPAIAPDVFPVLAKYHWPGNVRQLAGLAELAVLRQQSGITADFVEKEILTFKKGESLGTEANSRERGDQYGQAQSVFETDPGFQRLKSILKENRGNRRSVHSGKLRRDDPSKFREAQNLVFELASGDTTTLARLARALDVNPTVLRSYVKNMGPPSHPEDSDRDKGKPS